MDDDVVLEALWDVAEAAGTLKTIQNLRTGRRSMATVRPSVRNLRTALDHLDALQNRQ